MPVASWAMVSSSLRVCTAKVPVLFSLVSSALRSQRSLKAMVCTPNWPCWKLAKIMSTSLLRPGTNSAAWEQVPAPAFAVALGGFIALGQLVKDGIARSIDGGTAGLAVVAAIAVLVVGQVAEVGEVLQPPRLVIAGAGEQDLGEMQVEVGEGVLVLLLGGQLEGLVHQLQGADTVALEGVDIPAAFAAVLVAPVELAGHDETDVVVPVVPGQAQRGRLKQAPVSFVGLDDAFAEVIDLIDAAKLLEAVDGGGKVFAHLCGIVLRVQRELAQPVVGVLEVAVLVGFHERFALLVLGRCLGSEEPQDDSC